MLQLRMPLTVQLQRRARNGCTYCYAQAKRGYDSECMTKAALTRLSEPRSSSELIASTSARQVQARLMRLLIVPRDRLVGKPFVRNFAGGGRASFGRSGWRSIFHCRI